MERISRFRATLLLVVFALVLAFFIYTMYDLQILETGGVIDNTTTFTTITRVKAARGDIMDRNGNKLVGNRASYDLMLNHYVLLSANGTNAHLLDLVRTCEEQNIPYTDHFPVSAQKPFVYTLDQYNSSWKSYFQKFLDYQGGLDSDITAPLLVEKLREIYKIPEDLSDNEARKVIGLRYEMSLRNCIPSLSNYIFMEDADDETLSIIVELNIPGLTVEPSTVREYSTIYGAHVLGHVGPMSAEQWEYYKEVPGYEMDSLIGQSGLEQAYEEYLHGTDGWREDTVAADGTLISSRYLTEPKAGCNVEISIDSTLQMAAETSLASVIHDLRAQDKGKDGQDVEGGAVVAIDVKTGQILACANYPTYDPATYYQKYDELLETENNPLINRALLLAYPPGSAYKMITSIAALENHIITPTFEILDKGAFRKYEAEGTVLTCMIYSLYSATHKSINVTQALMYSCNYFYYILGDTMSIEQLDPVAKAFGLGEPTGVELEENIGYRSNPDTKKELHTGRDREFYKADMLMTVIGQSDNQFTTLQLAVYAATLANEGVRYRATFMNRVVSADYQELLAENTPKVLSRYEMDPSTVAAYKEGMHLVVANPNGTGFNKGMEFIPCNTAGKTGTAEQFKGFSDNGSFVCFAPLENPEIAIAVYIEKGGHGSSVIKVAQGILSEYFNVGTVSDVTTYENKLS
ncbi:MAG: hypothetical protein IKB09_04340 [Oscillospiraceae bacterium]|nr:hypothetical protein [Oscillospiraceae bacterium]